MPYLQVDLDAIDEFGAVAIQGKISEGDVSMGLLKLWRHCWKKKTPYVTKWRIGTFFPGDLDGVVRALITCEFLTVHNADELEVRGAKKRLGIFAARSKAGKENVQNLRNQHGSPEGPLEVDPEVQPRAVSGLTSSIQHPTSNKETTLSTSSTGFADVFTYWCVASGHTKAKADRKRRRAVEARLKDGYTVEQLQRAIDGCLLTPHNIGQNEQGQRFDDLELICRDAAHVDRFMHNAKSPPIRPTKGAARDDEKFAAPGNLQAFINQVSGGGP